MNRWRLAMRLLARFREELGLSLPLAFFYQHSTVATQALVASCALLDKDLAEEEALRLLDEVEQL